jgi:wobble nucleotide-excising tRNase
MISRIDHLRNFGIFQNFVGNEASGVPAFNKFNLIYGWNYSGKTTLSRVFQTIERKELPRNYLSANFKILQVDGVELNSSNLSLSPIVRVFNRDYVNENFRKEHSAPAVFIVGKENADLKARLAQLQVRRARADKIAGKLKSEQSAIENQISTLGTNRARDIGNLLGDRNFRRPNLDQRIGEVRQAPFSYLLNDETIQTMLATLRSGESFSELSRFNPTLPDLAELSHVVNELLVQTASNRAIEQLKNDSSLEGWVRQGLSLNQDKETCGFCGSPLTTERLEVLRAHFSVAYENLMCDLERKVDHIKGVGINAALPDEMRLMPEPRQKLPELSCRLNEWKVWAGEIRDQLITALIQKKSAIETSITWTGDLTRAYETTKIIQEINEVIESHNVLVCGIERAKSDAKLALERHYSALHFQENEIALKEAEIIRLRERSERATGVQDQVNSVIREIDDQISQSSIGANKLNEILKYLLVDSDIVAESAGNSEFRFLRGGEAAINLSDGEKTAVTLAYFLTSLEANGASPENAIVFVDDPISSLDSNHIYTVYALIVERLERCHQLFVSTHNSEFFKLLKGRWFNSRGGMLSKSSGYYVTRTINTDGSTQSRIVDLPLLLRKYNSEYEFVFSHLYAFAEAQTPTEHEAYTAPNLLRKFLEAYLGFRKPCVTAWHNKLDLLFDSPEERREVHKFADDASHLQSLNRCLQHPAFVASSQKCVRDVLNALKNKDPKHSASLEKVVRG